MKRKLSQWRRFAFLGAALFASFTLKSYSALAATASINGSSFPTVTSLTDATGGQWTVSSDGVINGPKPNYSAHVIYLVYLNNTIYQENASHNFWSWNGTTWVACSDPRTVSANGAVLSLSTSLSSGNNSLIDSQKNIWTVSGGIIYENGAKAGYSANVIELAYVKGTIYQENAAQGFWSWNGTTWLASGNPATSSDGSGTTVASNPTPTPSSSSVSTASGGFSIRVSGNHFIDGSGNPIQLRGVNVSGMEGSSFQNDPWRGQAPNWNAIKSWDVSVVRLPLSEANWLGLCSQTLDAGVTPQIYKNTIQAAVTAAKNLGIYVILDLHWIAVPNLCPDGQNNMADTSYSTPKFWPQVAAYFKDQPNVMFELFNEPVGHQPPQSYDWTQLLSGGLFGDSNNTGMQQMLDAVRSTGATNVVLVDGINWAQDLSGWITPTDTLNPPQVAAVQHYYHGSGFESGANPVLARGVPIIVTEYGDYNGGSGASDTHSLYGWADPGGRASQYLTQHGQAGGSFVGISYVAWTWNDDYQGWSLTQNSGGTPVNNAYGNEVHSHYLCRAKSTFQSCL